MSRALPPELAMAQSAPVIEEVAPPWRGKSRWRDGNRLVLLENGEDFFPRVFQAIAEAKRELLLETFILFDDKVGQALKDVLVAAARRGVRVEITIDGYGSAFLPQPFLAELAGAGVRVHVFDPRPTFLGLRLNLIHRMHRKIVVVDQERAFVGGINFSADHLADFGPEAKHDYSVEIEGPVVEDIHRLVLDALTGGRRGGRARAHRGNGGVPRAAGSSKFPGNGGPAKGSARVTFVIRDNHHHTTDIEDHYLAAIRAARRRILIVNAYFFPGFRLLRHLRQAASRGVEVELVVQGQPDMPIVRFGARLLYNYLIHGGVKIYEYSRRPVHAKVALVDDHWATVGSSNLDPLSLAVNLEANVVIRDPAFNRTLHRRFEDSMRADCQAISLERVVRGYWWRAPIVAIIFHVLRRLHTIARWLPARQPTLALVPPPPSEGYVGHADSQKAHVGAAARASAAEHRPWQIAKRVLTAAFFLLVAGVLITLAGRIDWAQVMEAVRAQSPSSLLLATAVGAVSYLVYSGFDLLGKRYTGHRLPVSRVLPVALACYAFSLNVGVSLGAIALRYRLYGRQGLGAEDTAKVLTLSLLTNWLGYLAVGGLVLAFVPLEMPPGWAVSSDWLRPLGLVMAALSVFYLYACARAKRRSFTFRGYTVSLPNARLGAAQIALGAASWSLMALLIDILLPAEVAYPTVLAVLLVGAVAGVLAHIPAGLGVLEAVYVALLGSQVGEVQILAALIGYRAIYYLFPLLLATGVVVWIEARARYRKRQHSNVPPG